MSKRIYRTWRDDLPHWLLYGSIVAVAAAAAVFAGPVLVRFFRGLSWEIFARERWQYLRWILQGLVVTLRLSAISMVFAMVLGVLVAVGRLSRSRLIRAICIPYIEFFRNTPLLVQLFFWYFGTSTLLDGLSALFGWMLAWFPAGAQFVSGGLLGAKDAYNKGQSEFISAVVGLSVYTSAFIAETVRAGIQAIPHGQTEAARSSGLTGFQTLRLVILPQAFRMIIPPLLSQMLALTKNSAQAMAIGVAEVTYMARQVEANTFKGFEAFTVATGLYMVISFLMSWLLNRYDHAISIPEMASRKQRLMALRGVPVGYALGPAAALASAVAGCWTFWLGGHALHAGSWWTGLWLYLLGTALLAAAAAGWKRPEWGVGVIRMTLVAVVTTLFFDLLGRLQAGLTAFDDAALQGVMTARQILEKMILMPLAWATLATLLTAWWWLYLERRQILFEEERP
jgi:polar amino acid transport system permease protein